MAEEPENMVLQILREIRSKQDEHSKLLERHSQLLERHSKQIEEVQETSLLAVGLATMANHKLDKLAEDHERRIRALEQRIGPAS